MKTARLTALIFAALDVVLAVAIIVLVATGGSSPTKYIAEIEVQEQAGSVVKTANYLPILDESVDWAELPQEQRIEIARAACKEALAQIAADETVVYNILGLTSTKSPAFLYAPEPEKVQIIVDNEMVGEAEL
ncbi:MAG: hypothetical protein LBR20_00810 [Propionibacteriaceae bacterium]|nr:hypothetical protein [Propionibacteriaceae bacterium]